MNALEPAHPSVQNVLKILIDLANDVSDLDVDTRLGLMSFSTADNLKYVIPLEHVYQVRTVTDDLIFEMSKEEFKFINVLPKLRLVK